MRTLINIIEIISVIAFFAFVTVRLYRKRKNLKIEKVIVFEYSRKYTEKINKIVAEYPKLFKFLGIASLISSLLLLVIGVYFLINSFISLKPSVALVLPTVSEFKYPGPIISVPFWIWIIAIFIIIFSHESMHALIAANEGVRTRRYGLLYLLIVPIGAFVDVDKKKMERTNIINKLKIYAAGSFGNLIVFLIFLVILMLSYNIINQLFVSSGVTFNNVSPDSPAEKVGLSGIIKRIDNKTINNIYDLQDFLRNTKPNTTVLIETTEGIYNLTIAEKNNVSYIGIVGVKNYIVYRNSDKPVPESILSTINYFLITIQWIAILSLGIAVANMLPIIPLDGGLMIKEILREKFGKKGEKISKIVSTIFLTLLLSSLFLSSLIPRAVS